MLIIGILLLVLSIGLGDFILSNNYQTLTLKPYQSTTISQAEVLAKEPIDAQPVQGVIADGTNTYTVYSPSMIINNQNESITLIILHNSLLLDIDYSLILISSSLIIFSILGFLYIYAQSKNGKKSTS